MQPVYPAACRESINKSTCLRCRSGGDGEGFRRRERETLSALAYNDLSIFAKLDDHMPRKSSVPIEITADERQKLGSLRRSSPKKRNWVRAEIILLAADGQTNYRIAKQLGLSRNTVHHWRYRFARERLLGLETRPIPGRPKMTKESHSAWRRSRTLVARANRAEEQLVGPPSR